jgi:hypothetical protein
MKVWDVDVLPFKRVTVEIVNVYHDFSVKTRTSEAREGLTARQIAHVSVPVDVLPFLS